MTFDCNQFRQNFPALQQNIIYLDSAATALKPTAMIAAINDYYQNHTANTRQVTEKIEQTREKTAMLIGAESSSAIIWTKSATESANLIANSYANVFLKPHDEIIVSELEHHSNVIPWLIAAKHTGAKIITWPLNKDGQLDMATFDSLLNHKTQLVAITQMSNVTGYQPDLATIIDRAHNRDVAVAVDGAQGIVHTPLNVKQLDVDFYFFSAHKLYGPTGLGVLYVKTSLLPGMSVWQGGGKMIKKVSLPEFEPEIPPTKFEPGTPNIASILGFNATLSWLSHWDAAKAKHYTANLAEKAEKALCQLPGFTSYRAANSPLLSFNIEGIHHTDIAILLAEQKIAIRTGELCAIPLMAKLGVSGVVRASFAPYNTHEEMNKFVDAVQNAAAILTEQFVL